MIERLQHAAVIVALIAVWGAAAAQESTAEFSEAETRLWMTDQLSSISGAVELVYSFEKSGSLEPGFKDEVRFTINRVNDDGTKAASLEFFTGERNFPVPPVDSTTVNPVIKVYFQGDVYEMNRLTDPEGTARERWRYFQRRIKYALAESAEVRPVVFEFDGRSWNGHEITFQPYVNDPRKNLFDEFANKTYTVVVSEELPGYVYRIETVVSSVGAADPLLRESLELVAIGQPAE